MIRFPSAVIRFAAAAVLLLLSRTASPASGQLLEIHHIDVEQGDATLLVMPNGSSMLIDSGLDGRVDEVADFIEARGISTVDAFVLTHYDSDHLGGIDKVLGEGIAVRAWYDRGGLESPAAGCNSQLCQYQRVAGGAMGLQPGAVIVLDTLVSIVVVAANGNVRPGPRLHPPIDEENALSVTLLVSYQGFNYLIGGDLTAEVERRLVEQAAIGDIDVYRVSHHGSETSTSAAFLAAIRPEVAIISNGSHAGYRHPRLLVLSALRAIEGMHIYQTNRLVDTGSVGDNTSVDFIGDPETDDTDGTISILVNADSYDIRAGPSTELRRYPIQRP
jgi:competence protein ComEC